MDHLCRCRLLTVKCAAVAYLKRVLERAKKGSSCLVLAAGNRAMAQVCWCMSMCAVGKAKESEQKRLHA
jgi:hypothetical protein